MKNRCCYFVTLLHIAANVHMFCLIVKYFVSYSCNAKKKIQGNAHLFVSLSFALRYSRLTIKTKNMAFCFVLCSLIG